MDNAGVMYDAGIRGRPLMIWGGAGGNREKKISEALLQEKIINPFSIFPPPPQIINGRPLMDNVTFFVMGDGGGTGIAGVAGVAGVMGVAVVMGGTVRHMAYDFGTYLVTLVTTSNSQSNLCMFAS